MQGKGSQKKARLERLKNEIIEYGISGPRGVRSRHRGLLVQRKKKCETHGLTTRKGRVIHSLATSRKPSGSDWILPPGSESTTVTA